MALKRRVADPNIQSQNTCTGRHSEERSIIKTKFGRIRRLESCANCVGLPTVATRAWQTTLINHVRPPWAALAAAMPEIYICSNPSSVGATEVFAHVNNNSQTTLSLISWKLWRLTMFMNGLLFLFWIW